MLVALAAPLATAAPKGITETHTDAAVYYLGPGERSLYFNEREASAGNILCVDECLKYWTPFEAGAHEALDGPWTVLRRPDDSLQWVFKGKPLYTYKRDSFPGARIGDGAARGVWALLKEFKPVPPGMRIETTLLGYVLADHAGHTLYVRDRADASEAGDAAALDSLWQPFRAPWLAIDQGSWTVETSRAGARQWAYKGEPLYTFTRDIDPGDIHGHGSQGEWSAVILEEAAGLPQWMTVQWTDLGLAYADKDGMTLYAPIDMDVIDAAKTCPEECMEENWRPVLAEADEESVGTWIIRENDQGQRQWSYKGRLVYTHTRDEAPGDMRGQGIAVGYRIGEGWRIIPVQSGIRRDRS
jgi:predicted lipoprotein with Yx(FWY)xxD motif